MYVLLLPIISDESLSPPTDILTYFLFIALAILLQRVVLPTPGGPTKHITELFVFFVLVLKAKYSIILSLTSFKP